MSDERSRNPGGAPDPRQPRGGYWSGPPAREAADDRGRGYPAHPPRDRPGDGPPPRERPWHDPRDPRFEEPPDPRERTWQEQPDPRERTWQEPRDGRTWEESRDPRGGRYPDERPPQGGRRSAEFEGGGGRPPGPAERNQPQGNINRDIDLDEIGPSGRAARGARSARGDGGPNKKALGVGAAVVIVAVVAYAATRPSGGPAQSTPVAGTTPSSAPSVNLTGFPTTGNGSTGAASNSPVAGASNAAAVDIAKVHVAVYNGSGVNRRAADIRSALVSGGFSLATVGGTVAKTTTTQVLYAASRGDSAAAVARALGIPDADVVQSAKYAQVAVVIGADWSSGTTYPAGATATP